MVMRYDGMTPHGAIEDRFALNVDLARTFADAAGVVPGVHQQGKSLLRLLDGSPIDWRKQFLVEHADPPGGAGGTDMCRPTVRSTGRGSCTWPSPPAKRSSPTRERPVSAPEPALRTIGNVAAGRIGAS